MSWFSEYFEAVWHLLAEAAPFLLAGFLLAGLLEALLSPEAVFRRLGGSGLRPVLLASLYGVPVPLCSCSVIPVAAALKRSGASKGATTAFLIATPETGVDSISVTWALLDPLMSLIRPVLAFVTAVATGGAVDWMVRRGWDRPGMGDLPGEAEACGGGLPGVDPARRGLGARLGAGWRYAFGPLLADLAPWFTIGFLISGVLALALPPALFTESLAGWPARLLMLAAGVPLYICASASTPIAAALVARGLAPGAALVFLLVGPATNATTMLIVRRMLGTRVFGVYLACIAGFALLAAEFTDRLYRGLDLDLTRLAGARLASGPGLPGQIAGAVLAGLLLWKLLQRAAARRRRGRAAAG